MNILEKIGILREKAGDTVANEILETAGVLDQAALEAGIQSKELDIEKDDTKEPTETDDQPAVDVAAEVEKAVSVEVEKQLEPALTSALAAVMGQMDRVYVDVYGSVSKELSEDQESAGLIGQVKSLETNIDAQLAAIKKSIDELSGNVPALGMGQGYRPSQDDSTVKEKQDGEELNPHQKQMKEDFNNVSKVLSVF